VREWSKPKKGGEGGGNQRQDQSGGQPHDHKRNDKKLKSIRVRYTTEGGRTRFYSDSAATTQVEKARK